MPELPEVQTLVTDLAAAPIFGKPVSAVEVYWPPSIHGLSVAAFQKALCGRSFIRVRRRAKYIVFDLCPAGHLLIHLRMTGKVGLTRPGTPRGRHEHVLITLGGEHQLRLHDTRKFGRLYLVDQPDAILRKLGPEPLDPAFTTETLGGILAGRRRNLKAILLDQALIAGLGNIYADEALWEARLHPCRPGASLSGPEARQLHQAVRKVLRQGIQNLGTTLGSGKPNFSSLGGTNGRNQHHLKVFRRTGLPCPRCRTPIQRLLMCQRSTHICPACQPAAG